MTEIPPNQTYAGPPRSGFNLSGIIPHRSLGLKLILVCGLALLMAIPALFVFGIVRERTIGQDNARAEVSEGVGGQQTVLGPVITVPFERIPNPQRPAQKIYGLAVAYAETGTVNSVVTVEERTRGIYQVPVFDADMTFDAKFDPEALRRLIPPDATPLWNEARLFTGVSDTRGISEAVAVSVNGRALAMEPAAPHSGDVGAFQTSPLASVSLAGAKVPELATATGPVSVKAQMQLTGAERFAMGPFAKDTIATMTSNWPDPSFNGGVLPKDHTAGTPGATEFTAKWRVAYLARDIPGAGVNLDLSSVTEYGRRDMGVRFMREANAYQSVERALKYAAMFIGLVFLSYFLLEVVSGARAHPAQYVLVGLAQAIFYVLLLAFAERYGFDLAFLIAATMTVLLTSAYAMSVFGSWQYGVKALLILTGIYGLIYTLMRAEGLGLLAGAMASFVAIALTMYVTRNIDWYGGRSAR
jgi:inner membrane protein